MENYHRHLQPYRHYGYDPSLSEHYGSYDNQDVAANDGWLGDNTTTTNMSHDGSSYSSSFSGMGGGHTVMTNPTIYYSPRMRGEKYTPRSPRKKPTWPQQNNDDHYSAITTNATRSAKITVRDTTLDHGPSYGNDDGAIMARKDSHDELHQIHKVMKTKKKKKKRTVRISVERNYPDDEYESSGSSTGNAAVVTDAPTAGAVDTSYSDSEQGETGSETEEEEETREEDQGLRTGGERRRVGDGRRRVAQRVEVGLDLAVVRIGHRQGCDRDRGNRAQLAQADGRA